MISLSPTYLIGFLGLLLPIIIHLWSRRNKKPVPFGSTRFITDEHLRSLRRLFPSDWLLLIIRMLIVAFLTAIISDIRFPLHTSSPEPIVLIDSIYAKDARVRQNITEITDSVEVRWFSQSDLMRLTNQNQLGVQTVITPLLQKSMPENLLILPKKAYQSWPLEDIQLDLGNLKNGKTVGAKYAELSTTYQFENSDNNIVEEVTYHLISPDSNQIPSFLTAILAAIELKGQYAFTHSKEAKQSDVVFVLNDTIITAPNQTIIYLDSGASIPFQQLTANQYLLSSKYDAEEIISHDILNQLYVLMNPFHSKNMVLDQRVIPPELRNKLTLSQETPLESVASLKDVWWSILLVLILLERWLSLK